VVVDPCYQSLISSGYTEVVDSALLVVTWQLYAGTGDV